MIRKSLIIVALASLAFCACNKDKDDNDPSYCTGAWATAVVEEWNAVYVAAMAYAANPTHETCVAYKDAYQDYIDELKKFKKCALWTPQQKAELDAAIDNAEDEINSLCSE
ncbi:MAG: hypothetical protein JW973_16210 [Bacteroidales bacterium]|nr:hypothetical protein [Bacteroidales bacterium]